MKTSVMVQGASCDAHRHSACKEIPSYRYTTFLADAQKLLPPTHDYSCRQPKTMPVDTRQLILSFKADTVYMYRGADKSLARPGRKQATAKKDFEFHTGGPKVGIQ